MSRHPLEIRRDSAQAALDHGRDRPWKMGRHDCVRMTAAHLRRMGYKVKLPPAGSYHSLPGAMRKLKAAGFASLSEALAAHGLTPIAPAAALVGDIIEMAGHSEALPALTIALGNGRVAGFYECERPGVMVLQPLEMIRAWRADPRVS